MMTVRARGGITLGRTCAAFIAVALVLCASVPGSATGTVDDESLLNEFLWNAFVRLEPARRPRIGLVLGGGGARGFAHVGVLKVLAEEGLPIDLVVGTSMGAIIGGLYTADVPLETIEHMGKTIHWDSVTNVSRTGVIRLLLMERLLSTERLERFLSQTLNGKTFNDTRIPFACVATDIMTGERVILREGELAPALRASATIPGVFDPVAYRHRLLVDGGLYENIPTDVARLIGADFVIASAISADFTKTSLPTVFSVLMQSIYIQGHVIDEQHLADADAVIRPSVGDVSAVELERAPECVDAGMRAARSAVRAIKKQLTQTMPDREIFQ